MQAAIESQYLNGWIRKGSPTKKNAAPFPTQCQSLWKIKYDMTAPIAKNSSPIFVVPRCLGLLVLLLNNI